MSCPAYPVLFFVDETEYEYSGSEEEEEEVPEQEGEPRYCCPLPIASVERLLWCEGV